MLLASQLSAQNGVFTRMFELTTPRMYDEDVQLLQQRLQDLGHVEVGGGHGHYGPSAVRGDEPLQPRPYVIAYGALVIGGWLPETGWIERWRVFNSVEPDEAIELQAWPTIEGGDDSPFTARMDNSGRSALNLHLQAPVLTAEPSVQIERGRLYVETGLHPSVVEAPTAANEPIRGRLQDRVEAWKRNRRLDVATVAIELLEFDVNRDGHTDYLIDASSVPTGSRGPSEGANFTLFELWLGRTDGEYDVIDFQSHVFDPVSDGGWSPIRATPLHVDLIGLFDLNSDGVIELAYLWSQWEEWGVQFVEVHSSDDIVNVVSYGPPRFGSDR